MTAESAPSARLSRAPSRRRELFSLGLTLARSRVTVVLGLAFTVLVTAVLGVVGVVFGTHERLATVALPGTASEILAWGPGMLVAFAAAIHAFRNDSRQGIVSLVIGRGVSLRAFVVQRVLALAALLTCVTALGTIVIAAVAALSARGSTLSGPALWTGLAGVAHGLVFALVMAPVALAALGTTSRGTGYLILLLVVVMPELLRFGMRDLPREWTELLSIPSMLATLRRALSPGHVEPARAMSALLVASLVAAVAAAACVHQAGRALRAHERGDIA